MDSSTSSSSTCIRVLSESSKTLDEYDKRRGDFGSRLALETMIKRSPVRVLSLTCSASGCERNWSTFEQIHTKKRNRLEQQKLNSLVYVMYNMKLRERSMKRRATMDPILVDHIESNDEWITEKESPILPIDLLWLEDQNMAFDISVITTIPESDDPVDSNAPSTSNISEGDCPPPSSRKRKATTLSGPMGRFLTPIREEGDIGTSVHGVDDVHADVDADVDDERPRPSDEVNEDDDNEDDDNDDDLLHIDDL
ncbi:uncharacterized protein LOC131244134 [Magnolia sinica]|uniref:uncharacterized protein LOC131244134 n=1 Tax=Magnolia sinica TaxID=86752 RepID=UPI00265AD61B|nr:uncharacterized protein LOC131244134 [Magnolia sinica]